MTSLRISSAELAARISLEPPQTANRVLFNLARGGEIVGNLLTDIVDVDGQRI
jgi:hypothetical protein